MQMGTARDPGIFELDAWARQKFGDSPDSVAFSRRNPFDPRMSATERQALVALIVEHGGAELLRGRGGVEEAVDVLVADRAAALDSHVCWQVQPAAPRPDSHISLKYQSCYSGLRVSITAPMGARIPAHTLSMKVEALRLPDCPERPLFPNDPPVWRYADLGIGIDLYQAAMARLDAITGGDCRCVDNSTNARIHAARWKLHCVDPFKWHSKRCWVCRDHGIDWESAQRTDFDGIYHDRVRDEPDVSDGAAAPYRR
ncbi:hypothetical protein [Mycobacteroides chelonae]|uniref:Uncharacterized protein n=1 Tax=Mycobacteroides chelonae TaxID=1774 RepID=A0A1S1LXH4_MYCCH|nr:hypothetical protein [Mycobacteroides chelonae]OHU76051.1 hypothetical protein BKG84_24455 [Mycobacteroides chelonae]